MANQENSKYDSLNLPAENKQQLAYQQIKEDILNSSCVVRGNLRPKNSYL